MHKIEYLLLLFLDALFRRLPFAVGRFKASVLYFLVAYVLRYRQKVIRQNLELAFNGKLPREASALIKDIYRHFVYLWMEFLQSARLARTDWQKRINVHNAEIVDEAFAQKKGAVLITGHFGNFEWINILLRLKGYPFAAVAKRQSNPYVDKFILERREQFGTKIFYMREAFKEGIKFLQNNGAIGLVADQDARDKGIFVDFFGHPASTFVGPALYHMRTGAPIILILAVRKDYARFDLHFEKVECDWQGLDRDDAIRKITQAHVSALEKWIRRYPEQWFWMHRRWKTQPRTEVRETPGA